MRRWAIHLAARLLALSALVLAGILILVQSAHAGGPLYVAGVSYFDPGVKGTPLIWAQGSVSYYTDQGDLSPLLPQASANALLADAFSRWTNIPTVALAVTPAGSLAEDVNGTNVIISGGVLTLPADIQPSAVSTPVGIVYDFDGQITETLLGTGSSSDCLNNAVYGGLDSFTTGGNLAHGLVILNGLCAQDPALLTDFEYRLIRVLGRVLGLAPTQANLNVWTGNPPPSPADQAGFPAKHAMDLSSCMPITKCLTGADQPKMDDRAALGRLYPVTMLNQINFPGKNLFFETTAHIHGTVRFPDNGALQGQGMQGVNVVARWIDPLTLQPSRTFVATAVSGFLYRGNAGNPITGFTDAAGTNFDQWGSDDSTLQGFFDLAGLEFPDGSITTSYQITIEPVDPLLSATVGPYAPLQVNPSGLSVPVVVPVSIGGDALQDLVMAGGAAPPSNSPDSQDYSNPVPVPGGEWLSGFNVTGGTNYYWMSAQANRTLSIEVSTVDESGNTTESKAQPVVGIWALIDPPGTPPAAATPSPFNAAAFAETRLDAQLFQTTSYRIGVTDWRGDARPDYAHRLRVLYGDTATPSRISVAGGEALRIQGLGFRPGMTGTVGTAAASVANFSSNQLLLLTPTLPDGLQTVVVSDPATGGFSILTDVVTAGAAATDVLTLLPVPNPAIPVGGTTPNALQFQVVQADGITPVPGATVALSTTNGLTLDACRGAGACSVLSDGSGLVITNAGVTAVGPALVTAQLAPASYANPSTAVTTLLGASSPLDLALTGQFIAVEQGTTLSVPLVARVLSNGVAVPGQRVNFQVAVGHGLLHTAFAITDATGYATNSIALIKVAVDTQVTACVAPGNVPCQTFSVGAIPVAALRIGAVSGMQQVTTEGQPFLPVIVRITDSASPPNPVLGANATFQNVLSRGDSGGHTLIVDGEVVYQPTDPVILGAANTLLNSDINGMAQLAPWASPVAAGEEVSGFAMADSGAQIAFSLLVLPPLPIGGLPGGSRTFVRPVTFVRPGEPLPDLSHADAVPNGGGFTFLTFAPEVDPNTLSVPVDVITKQDDADAKVKTRLTKSPKPPEAFAAPKQSKNHCEECGGENCSLLE